MPRNTFHVIIDTSSKLFIKWQYDTGITVYDVSALTVTVPYGDAFDFFIVTVNEAPHTHSFGKWMVTTNATCTESGIMTRECDCGQTERMEVAATGHHWDDGKVTKEPTETSDGEFTFTCTVCNVTQTVIIRAGEIVSDLPKMRCRQKSARARFPPEKTKYTVKIDPPAQSQLPVFHCGL